jgi:hypothetical protein
VNNEATETVANVKANPDETLSKDFSESNVSMSETTLLKDVGSADVSRGIAEAGFVTEFNDPFAWRGIRDVGNLNGCIKSDSSSVASYCEGDSGGLEWSY